MNKTLQQLCTELITAWDDESDVTEIINSIRIAIAVSALPTRPKSSTTPPLPSLPDFLKPHRSSLNNWWANRYRKHKRANHKELSKQTINALTLAHELNVLQEFCDYAAEKDWASLGFAGHTEFLQKLAKDKKYKSSSTPHVSSSSSVASDFVAYRPLNTDDTINERVNEFEF